ncbi:hypothetical protein PAHAL_3G422700 [Panicum hallii]|uniref:Uncharacterized protein n=1 Tax=Panicum hallii TaxID=206008 RepID=A0A2T8KL44_9POAL|nr:hypothetical protein PAHAL_3G422700 [Panicum hallii]
MLLEAKRSFQNSFFMEIYTIALGAFSKLRNNFIFQGKRPSSWKQVLKHDIILNVPRIKSDLHPVYFYAYKTYNLVTFFFLERSSLGGNYLPQGVLGCRF